MELPLEDLTASEHFLEIKGTTNAIAFCYKEANAIRFATDNWINYVVGIIQVQYRTLKKN